MSLPAPAQLAGASEAEAQEALAQAVLTVELLLGTAIYERSCAQEVLLGGPSGSVLLDHFPVLGFSILGQESPRGFYLDEDAGILHAEGIVQASSYRVDFHVGQKAGEVPAIVSVLVEKVARRLLGEEEDPTEILELAQAATAMQALAREIREEHRKKVV